MYNIYQIEVGDTLSSIASKIGTTEEILMTLNGLNSIDVIPGNFIVIPMNINLPFTSYIVKNKDNIYDIAKEFDINYNILLKINGLNKDDYIYPGQEIIIPNKDFNIYITKENDTLDIVSKQLGGTKEEIIRDNATIVLSPDQLIIFRKN